MILMSIMVVAFIGGGGQLSIHETAQKLGEGIMRSTNRTNNANAAATTPTPRQQQPPPPPPPKKMALVHWWYFPSSYDEWMPAEEEVDDHPGIPGGWV